MHAGKSINKTLMIAVLLGICFMGCSVLEEMLDEASDDTDDEPVVVMIPDVSDRSLSEGITSLRDAGLEIGDISFRSHSEIEEEFIISSDPEADMEVIEGSQVGLIVSSGLYQLDRPIDTGGVIEQPRNTDDILNVARDHKMNSIKDCVNFNPDRVSVIIESAIPPINVLLVDGDHQIINFGTSQTNARRANQIIRHYELNESCYIGRPDPSMNYFLADGHTPEGSIEDEDCVRFNPKSIEKIFTNGSWKIADGSRWIMDFGENEDEARQALFTIHYYGFTHRCFVGRPDPGMTYFRK